MPLRVSIFALLLVACGYCLAVQGQTTQRFPDTIRKDKPAGNVSEDPDLELTQQEMLRAMAIRREESNYKEHVSRAKENAQLAVEIHKAFTTQKALQNSDLKKLSRMEKLSRQIRSNAGGEENKDELKEMPPQLEAALERLVDLSAELQKKVESTPRQVVSAAVIRRANEIVELVRHIRTLYR
jgi:hypothetical protein